MEAAGRSIPSLRATTTPSIRLAVVRGSTISGHGWSAGDARNPLRIMELEMVARDGPIRGANQDSAAARRARIGAGRSESIEPSARGFSIARRARSRPR
jgi:hypothetical protein